jgi:hypothetical protein
VAEKKPRPFDPSATEPEWLRQKRASENRWFIAVLLTLILLLCGVVVIVVYNRRATFLADRDERDRLLQLQAKFVAQIKKAVSDPAYSRHEDLYPDQLSPVMYWTDSRRNAEAFIAYEVEPSSTEGVIHHLFNTPEERQALIRYLDPHLDRREPPEEDQ